MSVGTERCLLCFHLYNHLQNVFKCLCYTDVITAAKSLMCLCTTLFTFSPIAVLTVIMKICSKFYATTLHIIFCYLMFNEKEYNGLYNLERAE